MPTQKKRVDLSFSFSGSGEPPLWDTPVRAYNDWSVVTSPPPRYVGEWNLYFFGVGIVM